MERCPFGQIIQKGFWDSISPLNLIGAKMRQHRGARAILVAAVVFAAASTTGFLFILKMLDKSVDKSLDRLASANEEILDILLLQDAGLPSEDIQAIVKVLKRYRERGGLD